MTEQNTPRRFINLDDFYVEFNTTPDIKDGFDEMIDGEQVGTASEVIAESVAGPIIGRVRERGFVWEAHDAVKMFDGYLRRLAKRGKGGIPYKEVFDEFGLSIVKAVVNSEPELTRHLSIL
jgi:hypothetical protein